MPSTATASRPAVRATALLTPEATPAWHRSTAFITVVVSGAMTMTMPRASSTSIGLPAQRHVGAGLPQQHGQALRLGRAHDRVGPPIGQEDGDAHESRGLLGLQRDVGMEQDGAGEHLVAILPERDAMQAADGLLRWHRPPLPAWTLLCGGVCDQFEQGPVR